MNYIYSSFLRCRWRGWEVTGISMLTLTTAPGNWPEMHIVIAMARLLMPEVVAVTVYDGKYSAYYGVVDGDWKLTKRD